MSFLTIDTDAAPDYYDQITQLEGVEYLLEFFWSDRELCWYLSIYDQDQTPLATGVKLVSTWPLLRSFVNPALPPGRLILFDMTGQGGEIAEQSDLNSRFLLTYVTSDDPLVGSTYLPCSLTIVAGFNVPAGTLIVSAGGGATAPRYTNRDPIQNLTNGPQNIIAVFLPAIPGLRPVALNTLQPTIVPIPNTDPQKYQSLSPPGWSFNGNPAGYASYFDTLFLVGSSSTANQTPT